MENSLDEIKARLFLWHSALDKCVDLLTLGIKAKEVYASEEKKLSPYNFPSTKEHELIYHSSVELAIIYFIQILSPGYGVKDVVAGNNDIFIDKHLNQLVSKTIKEQDKPKVAILLTSLKKARNKMLGHADGKAFEAKHVGPIFMRNHYKQSWSEIDLTFWMIVIKNIRGSIGDYIREIEYQHL